MKFSYRPRSQCICGRGLAESAECIRKTTPWGEITFLRCGGCGSWCQAPAIQAASLNLLFDSLEYQGQPGAEGLAYSDYHADEASRVKESFGRFRRDLSPLLRHIPRPKVLEIGCATGSLLSVCREGGCTVQGLDWSERMATRARQLYGLNVVSADAISADFSAAPFDLVMLFGTLANLTDIRAYTGRFLELLKPGGHLVFTFSDAGSVIFRTLYRGRGFMFVPSTATFLSSKGCLEMLRTLDVDSIRLSTDRQRPSVAKLLKHGGLRPLLRLAKWLTVDKASLPFALPMPGVRLCVARKRSVP